VVASPFAFKLCSSFSLGFGAKVRFLSHKSSL
jgi:hypothetical protein